jgi:hypothetical protein
VKRLAALLGKQGARVVVLLVILGLSGLFLGLAAGYPLSKIRFEESDAVRLDQSQLVARSTRCGPGDPVRPADRMGGGRPCFAGFGLLGGLRGEERAAADRAVRPETAVSPTHRRAFLIVQAVR